MRNTDYLRRISVLEILIVFAIVAIILGGTLPDSKQNQIRAKVVESLKIASTAQEALIETCQSNNKAVVKTNLDAGFFYLPAETEEDYTSRILLGADCSSDNMAVILWTSETGAKTDPVIELVAKAQTLSATEELETTYVWNCHLIQGELQHVPAGCQKLHRGG